MLCLEAHRSSTAVVGEDLGSVPGSVRRAMDRDGLARSFVFEFESSESDPFPTPPERSLATLSTHDLPTFASYWRELDIDERATRDELGRREALTMREERSRWRRAVLGRLEDIGADDAQVLAQSSARKAFAGCIGRLAASPARLLMVDLEDLWSETEPQNRPGTGAGAGNFLRRARHTLEKIRSDPDSTEVLRQVSRLRRPGAARPCASTRVDGGTGGKR